MQRAFPEAPSNIGNLEHLQMVQAQIANKPTFMDRAMMVASEVIQKGGNYLLKREENKMVMAQRQKEQQQESDQKMVLAGYTPYNEQEQYKDYLGGWKPYQSGGQEAVPMGQRDYAIASPETRQQFTPQNDDVVEVGGKKWIRPKKEIKQPADKIYTRAFVMKGPDGYFEQRNIANAATGETKSLFTKFQGTPTAAIQREKAIADEVGKLTPIEQERLKWLKEQKKRFYDPDTKTYNEAGWAKFLKEKNSNPKLRAILEIESQPIELDETLGNDPTKPNWGD